MSASVHKRGTHHAELDVLRGIAVLCMVVNHCGLAWGGSETSTDALSVLVFVGEFAPVLFFFTSGVGNGLRSPFAPGAVWDTLYKAALLFFADWFLYPVLTAINFDFLAFIAASMLLLHWIHSSKHWRLLCWGLLGFAIVGRFGLGVALRSKLPADHWVLSSLGVGEVTWSSYSPLPWLAYPVAGYLAGKWLRTHDIGAAVTRTRLLVATVATGVILSAAGFWFAARGMAIFRWGTMSIGFFVVSVAAVALAIALAIAVTRSRSATRWVSTNGPASFAAVPLHYGVIALLAALGAAPQGRLLWALVLIPFGLGVLESARRYGKLASGVTSQLHSPIASAALGVGIALVAAAGAVALPQQAKAFAFVGQLVLCGVLANRIAVRARAAATTASHQA